MIRDSSGGIIAIAIRFRSSPHFVPHRSSAILEWREVASADVQTILNPTTVAVLSLVLVRNELAHFRTAVQKRSQPFVVLSSGEQQCMEMDRWKASEIRMIQIGFS